MDTFSQAAEACSSDAQIISNTIIGVVLIVAVAFCAWAFFKYVF